jgi:sec-independent protein translocase protein TatC
MALPGRSTFLEHLAALRRWLSRSLVGWLLATMACYPFWERLWGLLLRPLHGIPASRLPNIVASTPVAAVSTSFHVSMLGGALLASPWIAWQTWAFLSPALRPHERRWIRSGAFFLFVEFLLGVAFGYLVLLPLILRWLVGFGRTLFVPMWSLDAYASLCLRFLTAVGLLFEWPLVTFLLARIGLVKASSLGRWWRPAVVVSFVLACFFVPPDPVSQSILAVPMVLLYLLGIWTAHLGGRRRPGADGKAS